MMLTQFKTSRKRTTISKHFLSMFLMLSLALVVSCGDDTTNTGTTTTTTTTTTSPNTLTLTADGTSVLTNGTDSVTITATVLQNFAPVENVVITFSTTGGQISSITGTTDANGQAQIDFSSGPSSTNQIITITGTAPGIGSQTIPIQITGSTLSIQALQTNIAVTGSTTITVTAQDANSQPINNATITYSVAASSSGTVSLSTATDTSDLNGQSTITITGATVGTVVLVATGVGATASQNIIVSSVGGTFQITSPTIDPAPLELSPSTLTITVSAPTSATVEFITSVGTWDGGASAIVTKPVVLNVASAVLESTLSGIATIQVRDPADLTLTDSIKVAIYAPSSSATQINMQAPNNVSPSSGGTTNTVTIEATVLNSNNQVVGNAPILFTLVNPSGGGEYIDPVLVYTDATGYATTIFTAGTSTDASGVEVKGTIVGTAIEDTVNIVVGGTAGSIVIGQSTLISKDVTGTWYKFPISVLIADTNGSPVSGALVTLSLWPTRYKAGIVDNDTDEVSRIYYQNSATTLASIFIAEDANRSTTIDPGEDVDLIFTPYPDPGKNDGSLTPVNSAAGNIPASVTTDTNGIATFYINYLVNYAIWTEAEIKATTLVFGSETSTDLTFWLPILEGDEANLPSYSPYINTSLQAYFYVDPVLCDATTVPPGAYSDPVDYPNCPFIEITL